MEDQALSFGAHTTDLLVGITATLSALCALDVELFGRRGCFLPPAHSHTFTHTREASHTATHKQKRGCEESRWRETREI